MKVRPFVLVSVVGCLISASATAQQPFRQTIPDEHPGPPYYARGLVDATVPVVPIVFYRPPEKVPADFNLLNFFDIPRALSVEPLLVSGFHIVKGPLPPAAPPLMQNLSGDAVPIWFVTLPALDAAASDGDLKIGELEQIVACKGVASRFHEVLHPEPAPGGVGGAANPKINIVAAGSLDDGRSFSIHYYEVASSGKVKLKLSIK